MAGYGRPASFVWMIVVIGCLIVGLTATQARSRMADEESSAAAGDTPEPEGDVGCIWKIEIGMTCSDNVYHLSDSQIEKLEEMDPDDTAAGRFDDMESVTDTIWEPRIGLKMKRVSPLGGKVGIASWIQYHAHRENTARNYPEAELEVYHSVRKHGQLRMTWKYTDGFFQKNYLTGVDDANNNGNITRAERIYSPAIYNELEGVVAYRHTWMKRKKEAFSRLETEIFGGGSDRTHDGDLFRNRDKRIATAGGDVRLGFLSVIEVRLAYQFEDLRTDNQSELVLFDETVAGEDVNGDGEVKGNAALETRIDRSCFRNTVEIAPVFALSDDCELYLQYRWRRSGYRSDNPLDIDHYHQTAYKRQFRTGLAYDFCDRWSAEMEYRRTSDDDADDDDYTENNILAAVQYRF